jgi:hypothetical protein
VTDPTPAAPALPAWICKRDGRLVPFEPDKISRSLFAVTESLGRPDPFLARELTDGILHFLAAETEGPTPTTAGVADLAIKVVRELGQPALAQAFADGRLARAPRSARLPELVLPLPPSGELAPLLRECTRHFTLRTVFTRDLAAACADGLLTLGGLETPFEPAGCVVGPPPGNGRGTLELVEAARPLAGEFLILDGPEHALVHGPAGDAVGEFARELGLGLRAAGLTTVVNLNAAAAPPWADELANGPLFAATRREAPPARLAEVADALLDQLLRPDGPRDRVRIDWHLTAADFHTASRERLLGVVRRTLVGEPVAFTFDRPRRPLPLAEGVDRRHPAVLLTVGLHLPWLAGQAGRDPAVFLQKLGSLARLALSAAVRKREFLRRRRPDSNREFLLERGRLVVAPVGLDQAVHTLTGQGVCAGDAGLSLARQVVQRLREVLRQDGLARNLETCLDAPPGQARVGDGEQVGVTAWDVTAPAREQLRAAGELHAVAGAGTAVLLLPPGTAPGPEQLADWLGWAWRRTDVVRLRVVRGPARAQQLTVPWPE